MSVPISEPVEFFMVWTKSGHAPRKVHPNRRDAVKEARRLAGEHPGRKYIVLQATQKFHVPVPPHSAQAI